MANYINNLGQTRLGWRGGVQVTASTLLSSIYGVWNADTLGTSLDTSIFRAYNGEAATVTSTQLNTNIFGVWNADGTNNLSVKHAWNANGDAVDSKSGANGTIATPSGTSWTPTTMTYGSGKLGSGAFTFNGSNFVSLPADTLNFTGDFSVSAWIYVPTAFGTNISRIISCFDNQTGPTTYRGWEVVYNNGTVKLQIYPSGANYYIISVPMTLKDQWVHVTAVRIAGQQGEIYINGVAGTKTVSSNGATSASSISYGTGNLAYIGALYDSGLSPRYSVTPAGGFKIDSIQTFNGSALDQTAVTELYNSGNGQEYPFTLSNALIPTYNDAVGTNHGTTPASTITNGVPGPSFTTGKIGKAFNFDGINDYVALPNTSMNINGNFSISCWVNFSSFPSASTIISNYYRLPPYTRYYGWSILMIGDKVTFDSFNGVNASYHRIQSTSISLNTWNHVVVNYQQGGTTTIYVNGVLVGSGSTTTPIGYSGNETPAIGGVLPGDGFQYPTNGKIDALSIWNKVLSVNEITALYNSGNGQQYPFSSVTLSNSILDSVNSINGTNVGGVTFTTGKVGNAFTFNGSNYIQLPTNSLNLTGDFSISLWMMRKSAGQFRIFSNMWNGATPYGWHLSISNGILQFALGNGTSTLIASIYSSSALYADVFNLITITKSNTSLKMYINGVLNASATYANGTVVYSTNHYPIIGAWKYDNSAPLAFMENGSKIDGVTVWNKELTANEVTSLYNSGNGAEYPFSTQTLDSLNDAVGSNHGTRPASTLTGGVPGPSFTTGKIGKAFTFDGVNDYVQLPNNSFNSILSGDFSISMWVNTISLSSFQTLFSNFKSDGGGVYHGIILGINSNQFRFQIHNNTTEVLLQAGFSITPNTWNHIVVTRKYSTGTKIYVNGSLNTSNTNVTNPDVVALMYANIGAYINASGVPSGEYMSNNSKIDALSVWNRELTAADVTNLYNAGAGKQYPY